jgi:hypothetical protein
LLIHNRYTVEFGLVREDPAGVADLLSGNGGGGGGGGECSPGPHLKAFGAGILSSYGELEWFGADGGKRTPLPLWVPGAPGRELEGNNTSGGGAGGGGSGSECSSAPPAPPALPFAPLPRISYKDGYQREYFYLESFAQGADDLERMSEAVRRVLGG